MALSQGETSGEKELDGVAFVEGEGIGGIEQISSFHVNLPTCLQEMYGQPWRFHLLEGRRDKYIVSKSIPVTFQVSYSVVAGFVPHSIACLRLLHRRCRGFDVLALGESICICATHQLPDTDQDGELWELTVFFIAGKSADRMREFQE